MIFMKKHKHTAVTCTTYNKLVRDNIPDIIQNKGERCVVDFLTDEAYLAALEKKLDEEVKEFHFDKTAEELADILEVVYALAAVQGYTAEDVEAIRLAKKKEKGGFDKKIFLKETIKETEGYV